MTRKLVVLVAPGNDSEIDFLTYLARMHLYSPDNIQIEKQPGVTKVTFPYIPNDDLIEEVELFRDEDTAYEVVEE